MSADTTKPGMPCTWCQQLPADHGDDGRCADGKHEYMHEYADGEWSDEATCPHCATQDPDFAPPAIAGDGATARRACFNCGGYFEVTQHVLFESKVVS